MSHDHSFWKAAARAPVQLPGIPASATASRDISTEHRPESLKLLKSADRKSTKHRRMLEALRSHLHAAPQLEYQIRVRTSADRGAMDSGLSDAQIMS